MAHNNPDSPLTYSYIILHILYPIPPLYSSIYPQHIALISQEIINLYFSYIFLFIYFFLKLIICKQGSGISGDAKMADSPEESSWTFYIQGFICDHNDNDEDDDDNHDDKNTLISSELESPSLVSDAASSAVKKLANNSNGREDDDDHDQGVTLGFSSPKTNTMSKQTSFKKQKTKVMPPIIDYDLQDTASSPVNSPKVSYINQFMNQKEKAKMDVSEVKRNNFGKGGAFDVEKDSYYTDLKKKTCG